MQSRLALFFFMFFIGVAKELFPGQLTQNFGGAVPNRRGTAVEAGSAPVTMGTERNQLGLHSLVTITHAIFNPKTATIWATS